MTPAEKRAALARHLQQRRATASAQPPSAASLTVQPQHWQDPFPLTDVQQAYWLGQSGIFGLGNVATHMYFELDVEDVDLERLTRVFQRLIAYHPMLRAVIDAKGQQRILTDLPLYRPEIVDLRGLATSQVQDELQRLRLELSHRVISPDQWPSFDCRASLRDPRWTRLHVGFSLLFLDAWSIRLLMAQWALLYQFPEVELPPWQIAFRDVVHFEKARRSTSTYERAQRYWVDRLDDLPPAPELPLACAPESIDQPRFVRRASSLDATRWTRLKQIGAQRGLTPSAILLTAFSDVLRTWSRSSRFTINMTLFNRPAVHPQVDDLVGDFTSLTLLSVNFDVEESFLEFAEHLQAQLSADLDHTAFSGVDVLRELWKRHQRSPGTIMPVVFTSVIGRESIADEIPFGEVVYGISQTPQVWLDHQIYERGGALVYNWDYVEQLFPDGMIDDVFDAYTLFLRQLAEEPERWHERRRCHLPNADGELQRTVNSTAKPFRNARLESLFFEQAERQPDALAVISTTRRLTYAQLAQAAIQVTAQFGAYRIASNSLVAVVMEKGWEQVVAVLGVLRSGAAYLPIDPSLPSQRIHALLIDGECRVAITQPALSHAEFWPAGVTVLSIEEALRHDISSPIFPEPVATDDLAYVIYTSGSTGQPKGVAMTHRAVANTLFDMNARFGIERHDRVLAMSALSFDLSVYDIFGILAAGGTIVIPEADACRNPDRWWEWIQAEQVTVWNTVPALMEMLVESRSAVFAQSHPLRKVFLSGDWIPVSLPPRIRRHFPNAEVVSLGGATEAAIWSIYHRIDELPAPQCVDIIGDSPSPSEIASSIPYGLPLANQTWTILNSDLLPVPTGVAGELYIGGVGLAAGYWNDPETTAARFIVDQATGRRLYRTGDWGRYLKNGEIEFLGREDSQVKIHGHRIELGEIEAALCEHPDVAAAIVCAVGEVRSKQRLMAWVLPRVVGAASQPDLIQFLHSQLPAYMLPTAVEWREAFPLTPNGKVDRRALEYLATSVTSGASKSISVADSLDDTTREVWDVISTEMGLPHLEASENLMHVGASSIDMIRLANRFEERFGFRPHLPDFFRDPTVSGLTAQLRAHRKHPSPITPSPGLVKTSENTLLFDPEQRAAFKDRQLGLRRFANSTPHVDLPILPLEEERRRDFARRCSRRHFSSQPIALQTISEWLGCLQQLSSGGRPKYRYGSAGGAYPVQMYLHAKEGAVCGLESGLYYYDSVRHALVPMALGIALDREIHQPYINQPIFDQASLSVFLIGDPAAIEPLYGPLSLHFMTLEAGAMTQLLEDAAARLRIGLCQIGWLEFERIRPLFGLDSCCHLLHSLVGGPMSSEDILPTIGPASLPIDWVPTGECEFQEGEL